MGNVVQLAARQDGQQLFIMREDREVFLHVLKSGLLQCIRESGKRSNDECVAESRVLLSTVKPYIDQLEKRDERD